MVVVGVDAHKRTHTCVAVDGSGRKLGEKTVPATTVGNASALRWALSTFGPDLTWGIEDVRNVSRRLEQELVTAGQRVVRVPTHLMARTRAFARTRGKSDSIDATAVARAVLREPDLPVAQHDSVSRELQLLIERRETLVEQRTATVNRVQWRIHELDPVRSNNLKPLIYAKHRDPVAAWLAKQAGLVAELAFDELDDIARLTQLINALEKRIGERVRVHARHLLALPGLSRCVPGFFWPPNQARQTSAKCPNPRIGPGRGLGGRGRGAWARHCAAADAWECEQKAIAKRADQQHAWALAGDPRGTYGGGSH